MNRKRVNNNSCAILVLSCDKYSDLWDPFFTQFKKFWSDCPYKLYLGTNTFKYKNKLAKTILSGTPKDWSSDLFSILGQMKEDYLFIWVEDWLLTKRVNTQQFKRGFEFMSAHSANHIQMSSIVPSDGPTNDALFGISEKGAPYRVTVCGYWNREHLKRLLIPGENPWKFEIMGSYRASYLEGYFTVKKTLLHIIRTVEKGKIRREAYEYCKRHGIQLSTQMRSVHGTLEHIQSSLQDMLFIVILKIPWKFRLRLMEICRRLLVTY